MKKLSYYTGFVIFSITNLLSGVSWILYLSKSSISVPSIFETLKIFGSLIPGMVTFSLPLFVHIIVLLISLFIVARRLWLIQKDKEFVPVSFRGFPKLISTIGFVSFVLGVSVLIVSILFEAGSGVLAGLVFMPAAICIPWGYFLTEIFSFKKLPNKRL